MSTTEIIGLHIPEEIRSNFEKLANHLDGVDQSAFDMFDFVELPDEVVQAVEARYLNATDEDWSDEQQHAYHAELLRVRNSMTDCGTVGCALGHGPYAGIPKLETESWTDYMDRCFGAGMLIVSGLSAEKPSSDVHRAMAWCFSAEWQSVDNTPQGAAKRIRWMLTHNGVPGNHYEQAEGDAPLSY